jgi:nucleotide-binding universal stress UspA family protein
MARVLCTVDHTGNAEQAVRGAIARCRRRGWALDLVGVVQPIADAPSPAFGERVRRFGLVQANLVRAARAARAAGLSPAIALRTGDLRAEALAAARVLGASEIVFAEPRRFRPGCDIVTVAVTAAAAGGESERLAA